MFGDQLNTLPLGLTVDGQPSMQSEGDGDQHWELPLVCQLDAELQVRGGQEVVENVEDSDQ